MQPIDPSLVESRRGAGRSFDYVSHSSINELLLQHLGGFDLEVMEIIRGFVPKVETSNKTYPERQGGIVGVVARLTVLIDGERRVIEEVGTCENPAMKSHDGDCLKDAMSDALKRCAMRIGLGLHLWSGDRYSLAGIDVIEVQNDVPLGDVGGKRLHAELAKFKIPESQHENVASVVIGRRVESFGDLSRDEANQVWQAAKSGDYLGKEEA